MEPGHRNLGCCLGVVAGLILLVFWVISPLTALHVKPREPFRRRSPSTPAPAAGDVVSQPQTAAPVASHGGEDETTAISNTQNLPPAQRRDDAVHSSSPGSAGWGLPNADYPRLPLCMPGWAKLSEKSLPKRGKPPTLVFINYQPSNILEPMFHAIKNRSEALGFEVVRNKETPYINISYQISINFEEPNGVFIENKAAGLADELQALKTKESHEAHVFTMCPYSAEWVNNIVQYCKRTPMWQAMPRSMIEPFVPLRDRQFDVMYMSSRTVNGPVFEALTQVFPKFTYRWVNDHKWPQFHGKVRNTDYRKSLAHRLWVTRSSRAALIVNALFFDTPLRTYNDYTSRPILKTHPAFKAFFKWDEIKAREAEGHSHSGPWPPLVLPQMKSRTFEAAMSGALMLVFNDGVNIIEKYYEPDTEFVYWYNTSDLLQRLHDVVKFPDRYEPIARKAYERTQRQYTVDQWIDLLVMPFVRASQRE
uniref:Spore protein YkvP/CgeB glycosyl transferase-like domain-containing protein n=1 Tax=Eutreptiella gymnastica TaxID=73025 RepID=A0A7S4GHG5_9EUGL